MTGWGRTRRRVISHESGTGKDLSGKQNETQQISWGSEVWVPKLEKVQEVKDFVVTRGRDGVT